MKLLVNFSKRITNYLRPQQSGTVRYMFPVLVSLLAFLGASALTSLDSSYVKLSPSKTLVMEGEQFFIDIYAYAHVPVNALDIDIEFDPQSVEVLSVDKAQSVLTIWTEEPTISNNNISLGGGTYRRGFVGEHLVATVKVLAKNSGETKFLVKGANLLAGDGSGTPVAVAKDAADTVKNFIIYNQNEDPAKIAAALEIGVSADINGDGIVTLEDISSFMSAWYRGGVTYDFNSDTKMNFIDFSIILARSFFRSSS